MDGISGLRGWRWIMILEGIPTFVLGIACIWLLADEPDTAYYLDARERQMIRTRRAAQLGVNDEFAWPDVRKGLRDWKIWAFCAGQFCTDTVSIPSGVDVHSLAAPSRSSDARPSPLRQRCPANSSPLHPRSSTATPPSSRPSSKPSARTPPPPWSNS